MPKVREVGRGDQTMVVRRFTTDLPVEVLDRLDVARRRLDKGKALMVREAIVEYLDRNKVPRE